MTKTKTCTPSGASQTSGGKYQTFSNLTNIKTVDGKYAETSTVHGKSQPLNRPSTISAYNFKAYIPTGGLVTKITVKFKHSKTGSCNVTAPSVKLTTNNTHWKDSKGNYLKKKAQAPTSTATENTVSWSGAWDYNKLNDSNFKVEIDYPTNANDSEGTVRVYYVKIILTYKEPNFTVNLAKGAGTYNGDIFETVVRINNVNGVRYAPSVTITTAAGFTLRDWNGDGTLTTVSATVFEWSPKLGVKVGSAELHLSFDSALTYASGVETKSVTFEAVESLKNTTAPLTFSVAKTRPVDPTVDPAPEPENPTIPDQDANPEHPEIITLKTGQQFDFDLDFPSEVTDYKLYCCAVTDGNFADYSLSNLEQVMRNKYEGSWSFQTFSSFTFDNRTQFEATDFAISYSGAYTLVFTPKSSNEILKVIYVTVKSSSLYTYGSILTLSKEELNRLGDGYVYTVQTLLKEISDDGFVRDWGKNFRIGVFNNAIESNITVIHTEDEDIVADRTDYNNLSFSDLFDNAKYWSDQPTKTNTYENLECTFPYNDDYPLYVLITGDYESVPTTRGLTGVADISFTEPVIVENDYYTNRIDNGVYPKPINDLVLNDGSTSDININALSKSDTIVFYDLPLDDDFGTNDEIAVRGIALNGNVESNTDNLVLNASLVNSKNVSKNRSVVLNQLDATLNADNEFSIGQVGDLWGFSTTDIKELEDWEIHLALNNTVNDFEGHANFGNINITVYLETIEHQSTKCYINNEDLSYYGIFIRDVKIPEGLKTDTSYINVNGTDVNDPYRQNIQEKTIEIEFDIGDNCDLEGATLSLRQLTKLLVNERDQYNRPILNRIEFSHYPDVFWEYVMEEPLDSEIEINSYTAKAKLVIPAGTSYDKKPTVTNTTGYISGLAHVRPNIIFKPTSDMATITETGTGQIFNITYSNDWIGKYIEIDCDNRIVWLKEDDDDADGINITSYVDWNSDWFTIYGEYNFETIGCAILSVQWEERW